MKSEFKKRTEAIVNNIRLTRERRNYTQDYMAMKLNCSQNAYSKLELGYSKITVARLLEICEVLDVTIIDIIYPYRPLMTHRLIYNPALRLMKA
jgi:transcriptional regulator with XRE-family HTH domain